MLQEIPHSRLSPSPLNPRRHVDPGALAELAASIADKGVLQNLVVRPHGEDLQRLEIVCGERRWRAVALLIEQGRLAPDTTLPVAVRPCDDVELLRLATAENVARAELTPLEEAEAFAALVKAGQSTDAIAELVGRSRRFVQLRLALVEKLVPQAREMLREGKINVEQARALAMGDRKRQAEVLAQAADEEQWGDALTARDIKEAVAERMKPVAEAVFDRALYKGEIVTDPDDETIQYFADVGQFEKLQKAALRYRAAELKKEGHAFVEIIERVWGTQLPYEWTKATKGDAKAGALVWIFDGKFVVHAPVVKRKAGEPQRTTRAGGDGAAVPRPEMTKAFLAACRHRKTHALQAAIAASPRVARIAACAALLGARTAVRIEPGKMWGDDAAPIAPALRAAAKPFRKLLAGLIGKEPDEQGWEMPLAAQDSFGLPNEKRQAELIERLATLSERDLDGLHALLVSATCGSFPGFNPELGDEMPATWLAKVAGVEMAQHFTVDEAFLAKCGKPQLWRMLCDLDLRVDGDRPENNTGKYLRERILAAGDRLAGYVPPWCRFGSEAELRALLKADEPAPAAAKPAKAKAAAAKGNDGKGKTAPKKKPAKKVSRGVVVKKKAA